jgi:glutamate dehydrogenase
VDAVDSATPPPPSSLVEAVLGLIGDTAGPSAALTRLYLRRLPWDVDLTPEAARAEIESLLEFIRERPQPIKVRVFNPSPEAHGYTSPGAVVEINVDDSPFLVDSVTAELQTHDLEVLRVLHPVIGAVRDAEGHLEAIESASGAEHRESVQHYVLDRHLDESEIPEIEEHLRSVLSDVSLAVGDFDAMVGITERMIELIERGRGHYPDAEVDEAVAFMRWLCEENFVFLGYREYDLVETGAGEAIRVKPDTGLGILSDPARSKASEPVPLRDLPAELRTRYEGGDLLVISKTNRRSTVHRRARMDYVGVRLVDEGGNSVGEARLVGLFTSKAYMESVARIPMLRQKLADVESSEDLIAGSHDQKAIVSLVESFPKDELFALPVEDLRRVVMGLLALQERARVRLFVRRDLLDRGVRILVAMPRDRYSADLRRQLQQLFLDRYGGTAVDYHLTLGRSDIARLHFIVWVPEGQVPDVAFEKLDAEVMAMTRSWSERVADHLAKGQDRRRADELVERWAGRLPAYYTSSTELGVAAADIEHLERLSLGDARSLVGIHNEEGGTEHLTRISLYAREGKRPLSELTPALEDLGLEVVEEVPTRVAGDEQIFVHDFGVLDSGGRQLDVEEVGDRVTRALEAIWESDAETDSLSRLILTAGLDHHQVAILRAYETYRRRVSSTFTVGYVHDTLVAHPEITARLVELFELRFDPEQDGSGYDRRRDDLLEILDRVPSLDQDRILRGFLHLIEATQRTNAFRPDRRCLAFKLRSPDVPDMPYPQPHVEVFVLADAVEGIHLRAGVRARGGIRWSERREDYRIEVLGLMKAQVTKNAVIVPTGAKGGFVLRRPPADPQDLPDAVRSAYAVFIRGLLSVTDNLVDGEAVAPPRVRTHDGPDPYLVVAADKGTARFSDLANEIAAENDFWLDDAFASGGATGYDHKGLGITARGAWKSLERHFLEDGIDPHSDEFTAVGIGDMSGDVFGNGMLGSDTMKLVAAFDHRHVFLDPHPDPAVSYAERKRLFELPRSSWEDYNPDLISTGGGVFPRSAKSIDLSEPARAILGTDRTSVTPAQLIRIILQAPVDLIWNGGIGTYVKATSESDAEVGDRANDAVRVNGSELRARIVVEGGNLGLTQLGRIEYARSGGKVNTDFIDNSAGVNCSDREVNLKILLRQAEQRGEIDRAERDLLLAGEAENVVAAILDDCLQQAQLLGREEKTSPRRMDAYEQLMVQLEDAGVLDRSIEWLPGSQEMADRSRNRIGLTRPELAVLLAYAKQSLTEAILATDLVDDREAHPELRRYFPGVVSSRFEHLMWDHPLRRELIATLVANDVVDTQGPTFISRLVARSGAGIAAIVGAYRTAREVSGGVPRRTAIEDLFGRIDYETWNEMMAANDRLVLTLTRWYLTHGRPDVPAALDSPEDFVRIETESASWGSIQWRLERNVRIDRLESAGVPTDVATRVVAAPDMFHAPDVAAVAANLDRSTAEVGRVFHRVGRVAGLDSLERVLADMRLADPWHRWALETIEDDLLGLRRALAERVLGEADGLDPDAAVEQFLAGRSAAVVRVVELAHELEAGSVDDPTPLMVAVRQVEALTRP